MGGGDCPIVLGGLVMNLLAGNRGQQTLRLSRRASGRGRHTVRWPHGVREDRRPASSPQPRSHAAAQIGTTATDPGSAKPSPPAGPATPWSSPSSTGSPARCPTPATSSTSSPTGRPAQPRRLGPRPHRPGRPAAVHRAVDGRRVRGRPRPGPHPRGLAVAKAKGRLHGKPPKLKPTPGSAPGQALARWRAHHARTGRAVLRQPATVYRAIQRGGPARPARPPDAGRTDNALLVGRTFRLPRIGAVTAASVTMTSVGALEASWPCTTWLTRHRSG